MLLVAHAQGRNRLYQVRQHAHTFLTLYLFVVFHANIKWIVLVLNVTIVNSRVHIPTHYHLHTKMNEVVLCSTVYGMHSAKLSFSSFTQCYIMSLGWIAEHLAFTGNAVLIGQRVNIRVQINIFSQNKFAILVHFCLFFSF